MAVDQHDEPIGWYGLAGAGRRLILDHLWVRPHQIGLGVGRALFRHALHRAAERHAEEIEWEADPHAAGFYERMGAKQIGHVDGTMDGTERCLPLYRIRIPAPACTCSGKEHLV